MQIYDVTLTISSQLPVWPGDPEIKLTRTSKMEDGADANVTYINMGAHTGTHVDAPYHFLGNGQQTVDQLSLSNLTGRAYLLRIDDEVDLITADVLEQANIPSRTRRIIFKTRNSNYWASSNSVFQKDFVALSADGAQFLLDKGIRLVGIDYLSIAPYNNSLATHQILLGGGVIILEGLDLSQISPGRYTLYCLPLKLSGADGAPARVILIGV